MKKITYILMLLIAALLFAPAPARSQERGNHDELRRRFEEMRKKQMEMHDKNKDGKIDDEERKAVHDHWRKRGAEMRKKFIDKYDKNKDGKIDDEERTHLTKEFMKQIEDRMGPIDEKTFDADGDGKVTEKERTDAARRIQQRFLQGRKGGRSWGGRRAAPDPADFDGNGTVSEGEKKLAEAMLTNRFNGVL